MFKATRKKFELTHNKSKNNTGFDYHEEGILMKKVVSNHLLKEPTMFGFLKELSKIFAYLVDSVKNVKRTFIYSVEKDNIDFN